MDMQVGIFMSEVSKFVSENGPSTVFSFKVFTEPTEMDLNIIRTGISMYLYFYEAGEISVENEKAVLCIVEEIDEELADIIQDYRGYVLNVLLPITEEKLVERFMKEISYSLNFLKLKNEPMGFKEVVDNV